MKKQRLQIPEEIKEYISYCPESGLFHWIKCTRRRGKPGDVAGCLGAYGYWLVPFMGVNYRAHRLAWWWVYGEIPEQIDHINRKRNDNRFCNLRASSAAENVRNACNKGALTGVKGVTKNGNRFYGRVHFNYKSYNAGSYGTVEEAEAAVKSLREKLHKEFTCHD